MDSSQILQFVRKTESCWTWTRSHTHDGYAQVYIDGRNRVAHRIIYQMRHGQIPDGMQLDHLCRNRGCVNPEHLEAVDHRTNALRGASFSAVNAAKTACIHGHEFSSTNTYVRRNGRRDCRACFRARTAAYTQRQRMKAA